MKYLIILLITSSAFGFEHYPNNRKWSTRTITWKAEVDLREATINAICTWNGPTSNSCALNAYFEFVEVDSNPNINVSFKEGVNTALGGLCTSAVRGNEIYHAEISIYNKNDLAALLLHEFGHALGLDHSTVDDAIMNPKFKNYNSLHKDDIEGICSLYAVQVTPPVLNITILKKRGNLYLLSCDSIVDWIYADGWIDRKSCVVSHRFKNVKYSFVTVEYRGWSQTSIIKKRR